MTFDMRLPNALIMCTHLWHSLWAFGMPSVLFPPLLTPFEQVRATTTINQVFGSITCGLQERSEKKTVPVFEAFLQSKIGTQHCFVPPIFTFFPTRCHQNRTNNTFFDAFRATTEFPNKNYGKTQDLLQPTVFFVYKMAPLCDLL